MFRLCLFSFSLLERFPACVFNVTDIFAFLCKPSLSVGLSDVCLGQITVKRFQLECPLKGVLSQCFVSGGM